jgi:serralysin
LPRLCIDKIIKNNIDPYKDRSSVPPSRIDLGIRRKFKFWDSGQTLHIRFLSGDPIVQRKVKAWAGEYLYEAGANLRFNFISEGDADIRIDFQMNGSWSYIGTDAKYIPQNQATMNYGWLQADTDDDEYYIVLHEFGHVLGLIHEVQFL